MTRTSMWTTCRQVVRCAQLTGLVTCAEKETGNATLDPYSNRLVMPLADFIEHPLAHELVHNGQALQVSLLL